MNSGPTEPEHRTDRTNTAEYGASAADAARAFGVVLGPSIALDLFAALGTVATATGWPFRQREGLSRLPGPLLVLGGLFPWAYAFFIRPWHLGWGATDEERAKLLPGDELVPDPVIECTRAITVDAPASEVWQWLVQMGQGRGGLYSYDLLENLAGLEIHSADRIVPEHQILRVGDLVRLAPKRFGPEAGFRVVELDREKALLLHQPTDPATRLPMDRGARGTAAYFGWNWAFVLKPAGNAGTRLLIRSRVDGKPRLLVRLLFTPLLEIPHFVMERVMLKGIKKRAERG